MVVFRHFRWGCRSDSSDVPPLPFFQRVPQEHQESQGRESPAGWRLGVRPCSWKSHCQLWQVRLWLGHRNGGAVGLGLYGSESDGARIWRAVVKGMANFPNQPLPLAAWKSLRNVPGARSDVLPRWVKREGDQFFGAAKIHGQEITTGKTTSAEKAFLAVWRKVKPLLPAEPSERPEPILPNLFDSVRSKVAVAI